MIDMAHYAELDENNVVIRVISGVNENDLDSEDFYSKETGKVWKRTSYNTVHNKHKLGGTPFRGNYAGIGYTYDPVRDKFIPPKPEDYYVFNEEMCDWEVPVPYPTDGKYYTWNETQMIWVLR